MGTSLRVPGIQKETWERKLWYKSQVRLPTNDCSLARTDFPFRCTGTLLLLTVFLHILYLFNSTTPRSFILFFALHAPHAHPHSLTFLTFLKQNITLFFATMLCLHENIPTTPQKARRIVSVLDIDYERRLRRESLSAANRILVTPTTTSKAQKRSHFTPVPMDEDSRMTKRRCVSVSYDSEEDSSARSCDDVEPPTFIHLPMRPTNHMRSSPSKHWWPQQRFLVTPKHSSEKGSRCSLQPRNLQLDLVATAGSADRLETSMSSICLSSDPLPFMPFV